MATAKQTFKALDEAVLDQIAEEFAVDFTDDMNKTKKIEAILESGITMEMYKEAFPDVEDQSEVEEEVNEPVVEAPTKARAAASRPTPTVLLKMERENPRFEIRGYAFTKDHPFLPVKEEDAVFIINHEEGFRIALPSEAEAFYS